MPGALTLDDASFLESVEIRFSYDPSVLRVVPGSVATGTLTDGQLMIHRVDAEAGLLEASIALVEPLDGGSGTLLEWEFEVPDTAPTGGSVVDLERVSLNEEFLVLTPLPVPGPDGTDGSVTILDKLLNTTAAEPSLTYFDPVTNFILTGSYGPAGYGAVMGDDSMVHDASDDEQSAADGELDGLGQDRGAGQDSDEAVMLQSVEISSSSVTALATRSSYFAVH